MPQYLPNAAVLTSRYPADTMSLVGLMWEIPPSSNGAMVRTAERACSQYDNTCEPMKVEIRSCKSMLQQSLFSSPSTFEQQGNPAMPPGLSSLLTMAQKDQISNDLGECLRAHGFHDDYIDEYSMANSCEGKSYNFDAPETMPIPWALVGKPCGENDNPKGTADDNDERKNKRSRPPKYIRQRIRKRAALLAEATNASAGSSSNDPSPRGPVCSAASEFNPSGQPAAAALGPPPGVWTL
eukprot:gnl/TRDRNA2_/TRDRNA2_86896_c0_seq1.p1 gnl/TRDRNA2_/TRDRNA2_86896_c0~~gnl/TRDRNA2_/TRDRNA2_86896_c0_seq1.p1  ORF type:complete len:239 (-),score=30.60 gnl/TRDRNA2_/TRDRNA2_86896_c0_seq1:119-835(-)